MFLPDWNYKKLMPTSLLKHWQPTLVIYSLNVGRIHGGTPQCTIHGRHFIQYT